MKNVIIVESKNDQHFLQYLVQYLNSPIKKYLIEVDSPIFIEDDNYECLDGLSESKLKEVIENLSSDVQKGEIRKIGIIIDQDNDSEQDRLDLVNRCLSKMFILSSPLSMPGKLVNSETKENSTTFQVGCYFTNIDGKGELETVLKTIKSQSSPYADCLDQWRDCLGQHGQVITDKEFDKFWWSIYLRYDTCEGDEKKQAGKYCAMSSFNVVLREKGTKILDLDHPSLDGLKNFLRLFDA